jgi:hypothetical protein
MDQEQSDPHESKPVVMFALSSLGRPFSSIGALMSKAARTDATVINNACALKYRPGHILCMPRLGHERQSKISENTHPTETKGSHDGVTYCRVETPIQNKTLWLEGERIGIRNWVV